MQEHFPYIVKRLFIADSKIMHYSWFYNYLLSRIQECRELSTKKYQATSVTGTLVKQSEGKPVLRFKIGLINLCKTMKKSMNKTKQELRSFTSLICNQPSLCCYHQTTREAPNTASPQLPSGLKVAGSSCPATSTAVVWGE